MQLPCLFYGLRTSDGGVVASGEDNDAAGHLEEDGAAECLGEILAAGDLSVVGHQDDVVVCKGLYYRCGEFVRAGREERHYGYFPAYVQRPFEGDVEILGLVLHAGDDSGIRGLEVQDASHFRPPAHDSEVKAGLHRWPHSVQAPAVADAAEGDLVFPQFFEPAAGGGQQGQAGIAGKFREAQGQVAAAAGEQSGFGAFMGASGEIIQDFLGNVCIHVILGYCLFLSLKPHPLSSPCPIGESCPFPVLIMSRNKITIFW